MKKVLILLVGILFLTGVSVFGAGWFGGVGFEPAYGSNGAFHFGWMSDGGWSITATKSDMTTWQGDWDLGLLWTPEIWNGANLKAGVDLTLNWSSNITYNGIKFELGVTKWVWKAEGFSLGFYGEFTLNDHYELSPMVGMEALLQIGKSDPEVNGEG